MTSTTSHTTALEPHKAVQKAAAQLEHAAVNLQSGLSAFGGLLDPSRRNDVHDLLPVITDQAALFAEIEDSRRKVATHTADARAPYRDVYQAGAANWERVRDLAQTDIMDGELIRDRARLLIAEVTATAEKITDLPPMEAKSAYEVIAPVVKLALALAQKDATLAAEGLQELAETMGDDPGEAAEAVSKVPCLIEHFGYASGLAGLVKGRLLDGDAAIAQERRERLYDRFIRAGVGDRDPKMIRALGDKLTQTVRQMRKHSLNEQPDANDDALSRLYVDQASQLCSLIDLVCRHGARAKAAVETIGDWRGLAPNGGDDPLLHQLAEFIGNSAAAASELRATETLIEVAWSTGRTLPIPPAAQA